ncbi:MAG: transposase family protein [Symploca sp. SIO2G7]|nr:transposase family protein [Symploca sp. SIO2G7]
MDFHLDSLLNLPNVTVFTHRQKPDYTILQLELLNDGISCPYCQKYSDGLNQIRPILVRDLSISGQAIYLQVPRRQFYCKTCRKYSTEPLVWMDTKRNYTLRYEDYIYEQVQELTVDKVSFKERISAAAIAIILRRVRQRKGKIKKSQKLKSCLQTVVSL